MESEISALRQLRVRSGKTIEECAFFFGVLPSEIERAEHWPEALLESTFKDTKYRVFCDVAKIELSKFVWR